MLGKLPPHSIEAEQSTLGGLLNSANAWADIGDQIQAEDFYREDHRLLFGAIASLAEANEPFDQITVVEKLRSLNQLDRVTAPYIGQLAVDIPGAANIRSYAQIVRDRAVLRSMIRAGDEITTSAFEQDGVSTEDKLDAAEKAIGEISQKRESAGFIDAAEACRMSVDRLEKRLESGSSITGQRTGFVDYDQFTTGLQDGELTIVAGRPSMGKSAWAMQAAYHVASQGGQTLCFSLEMPAVDINDRQLSALSSIPLSRIRSGQMHEDDWPRMTDAMGRLRDWPMRIVDMPAVTARGVRTMARRAHRKAPVRLIVIDYLQLMQARDATRQRHEQLTEITSALKGLARELSCPVMCLSQLNRGVEQRQNKRPMMADLRESGGIEQDADNIAFLYRDEVYNDDSPHEGVAEVILGKQRNGPIGHVELAWDAECVRFRDYTGPSRSEREPRNVTPIRKTGGFSYE